LSLGSPALRWNGNFGTVTTTNLIATTVSSTNGIFTNLTSANGTITTLNNTTLNGTNATFVNATTTNATSTNQFATNETVTNLTATNATFTNMVLTGTTPSSFANIIWTNATGTNTTSTNLFATNSTLTNGTITNGNISNLTFANGTSTSWFGFATASGTTMNALNGTVANFNSGNAIIAGGSINGTPIGNTTPSTGIFTNTTSTNLSATNATIANLTVTGATPSNFANIIWTNATGTNTTSTNLFATNDRSTNDTVTNLSFTNGTSTSWFGFATASGTTLNASAVAVNGSSVCLLNGINCPVGALVWSDNNASGFISPSTSTRDVVIGSSTSATAPFYFDVNSPTSSLQIGRSGNANLFVGTSTYGGGLNSLFAMSGQDEFVQGMIGAASSVYSNGGFVASNSGSSTTMTGNGVITTNASELVMAQTGDTLGGTSLHLQSRFGSTGAVFQQDNPALNLVDFGFKIPQEQSDFRLEGRNGTNLFSTGNEFEYIINATSSATYVQFAVASSAAAFQVPLAINTTDTNLFTLEVNGNIGPRLNNTYNLGSTTTTFANVYSTSVSSTNVSTTNLYVGNTFAGAGLSSDCSGVDRKLTWNSTTRQFGCAEDLAGNTKTSSSSVSTALSTTQAVLVTVTITPQNTNSEIWVVADVEADNDSGTTSRDLTYQIHRGATCAGSQVGTNVTQHVDVGTTESENLSMSFIDAPSTTSAESYVLCGATGAGSPTVTARSITVQEVNVGADLAEVYYSQDKTVSPGEVVDLSFDGSGQVQRSSSAYDPEAFGVVSTRPGVVLSDSNASGSPVLIALAGRIPVKVTGDNGAIKAGDYLAASDIPGMAMKATQPGVMIGRALEGFDPAAAGTSTGEIMVFVQNGYYIPASGATQSQMQAGQTSNSDAGSDIQPTGQTPEVTAPAGSQSMDGLNVNTLVVKDATFSGRVTVKDQAYFGPDTVGEAKVLSGAIQVQVKFSQKYLTQPIVTVSPMDFVDVMYRVTDVNDSGFTIQLSSIESNDKLFSWHAFGNDQAKLTVSDGTTQDINIVVSDDPGTSPSNTSSSSTDTGTGSSSQSGSSGSSETGSGGSDSIGDTTSSASTTTTDSGSNTSSTDVGTADSGTSTSSTDQLSGSSDGSSVDSSDTSDSSSGTSDMTSDSSSSTDTSSSSATSTP
ncbi:MAG: hypothetical protein WA001_02485, partial [Patescibacteria group bacterium]